MVAYLDGIVSEVREASVVIQAGAFGMEVFAPTPTLAVCEVGSALRLHTYLLVKEDLLALYGFHSQDLHTLFSYLIRVGGVGPKLAVAMLSTLQAPLLAGAILQEDAGLLASTPGVGKRLAEKIIVELKTKLPEELMAGSGSSRPQHLLSEAGGEAVEALLTLGYRESQVKAVVAELALSHREASTEGLIRKALAKLR